MIHSKRGGHSRRFKMSILEPLDEEVPQPKILFKEKAALCHPDFVSKSINHSAQVDV